MKRYTVSFSCLLFCLFPKAKTPAKSFPQSHSFKVIPTKSFLSVRHSCKSLLQVCHSCKSLLRVRPSCESVIPANHSCESVLPASPSFLQITPASPSFLRVRHSCKSLLRVRPSCESVIPAKAGISLKQESSNRISIKTSILFIGKNSF